jgi:hypothetical protein
VVIAAVNAFASFAGEFWGASALDDANVKASLQSLSVQNAAASNAEVVDADGVYYQSWAGFSRPFGQTTPAHDRALAEVCKTSDGDPGVAPFGTVDYLSLALVPLAEIAGKEPGAEEVAPNDGLATVASAKWGNFRGCIAADHQEQLGQRNIPDVNVRSGFDVARFYTNVAGDLATRGF